jgi:hypothetical protein
MHLRQNRPLSVLFFDVAGIRVMRHDLPPRSVALFGAYSTVLAHVGINGVTRWADWLSVDSQGISTWQTA